MTRQHSGSGQGMLCSPRVPAVARDPSAASYPDNLGISASTCCLGTVRWQLHLASPVPCHPAQHWRVIDDAIVEIDSSNVLQMPGNISCQQCHELISKVKGNQGLLRNRQAKVSGAHWAEIPPRMFADLDGWIRWQATCFCCLPYRLSNVHQRSEADCAGRQHCSHLTPIHESCRVLLHDLRLQQPVVFHSRKLKKSMASLRVNAACSNCLWTDSSQSYHGNEMRT